MDKEIYLNQSIIKLTKIIKLNKIKNNSFALGIGDGGLGIGDWGLGPIPNPQSPIPNPYY